MQPSSHVSLGAGFDYCRNGARVWSLGPVRCFFVLLAMLCVVPALFADIAAPTEVPFHLVRGFAVVIPVTVNGHGPYDFMLDTGSTITAVDRELGAELALAPEGQGTVSTLTQKISVSLAIVRVDFGPMSEQKLEVMVRDLKGLREMVPTARGVLGQNALNHADFLLDYQHKRLQFDMGGEVLQLLSGHRVPLRRDPVPDNPAYANLAVHGSVMASGVHAMEFLLDSGAATPVIFGTLEGESIGYPTSFVTDTAGRQSVAGVRTLQLTVDNKSRELATQVVAYKDAERSVGGLLPTFIFSRIYISNTGGFAMFEPKVKKANLNDRMIAGLRAQATAHGPKS